VYPYCLRLCDFVIGCFVLIPLDVVKVGVFIIVIEMWFVHQVEGKGGQL